MALYNSKMNQTSSSSGGQNPLLVKLNYPPEVEGDPEKYRFQVELEFVQCLANPNYLNFLSQHGYLKDTAFINYLNYLQYWKQQQYAKFLRYPQCLHFLELLQSEQFRREIANMHCAKFIDEQVLLHWHHYNKKRSKTTQQLISNNKITQKIS